MLELFWWPFLQTFPVWETRSLFRETGLLKFAVETKIVLQVCNNRVPLVGQERANSELAVNQYQTIREIVVHGPLVN